MWALRAERTTGCQRMLWQPLMRRIEAEAGVSKRSLANSLLRLEERRLVVVDRPGQHKVQTGRYATSFELTEAGRVRARELQEYRGVTRATAEREQRSRDPLAPVRSQWSKERERVEALVLSDHGLINDLELLYGPEPELGSGSPSEEAAKRFLLLARSRFFQDFVLHELADALAVVDSPTPVGQSVIGLEMAWGGGKFDPNEPLTSRQLDLIAALLKTRSSRLDD